MKTNELELTNIIKELNDNRSKLSALFSLYNSSLLTAEDDRATLSTYYEQMVDFKNDLNMISNVIYTSKKDERQEVFSKNKSKIKSLGNEISNLNVNFKDSCNKYKLALQECGSLKTEYKHEISELCKKFKSSIDENTSPIIIKGFKQQVKIIKAILERIEMLIADYNVKKNKVDEDNERFTMLYESVNSMLSRLKTIA